jgi:predicted secreted protein
VTRCPMRILIVASAVAVLSLSAIGIGSAAPAGHIPIYTGGDSGQTAHLIEHHEFKVSLETSTDGGYSWAFKQKPNSAVVKLVSKHLKSDPHKAGTVGFGSHTIFLFRAVGRGTTSMRLVERRSFEKSNVVKRFSLKEVVRS